MSNTEEDLIASALIQATMKVYPGLFERAESIDDKDQVNKIINNI